MAYGEGEIAKIAFGNYTHQVLVSFIGINNIWYKIDGCLPETENRILFHGHNLKITVEEHKPERWPWINVYIGSDWIGECNEEACAIWHFVKQFYGSKNQESETQTD